MLTLRMDNSNFDRLIEVSKVILRKIPKVGMMGLSLYWVVLILLKVDPKVIKDIPLQGAYGPALLVACLSVWIWLQAIGHNTTRSTIWALATLLGLSFRLIGIGHAFNIILLISIALSLDYYLTSKSVEK